MHRQVDIHNRASRGSKAIRLKAPVATRHSKERSPCTKLELKSSQSSFQLKDITKGSQDSQAQKGKLRDNPWDNP